MERDESAGNVTAVVAVLAPAAGAVSNKDKKEREKAAPGPADVYGITTASRCRLDLSLQSRRGHLAAARAAILQSKCS